MLRNSAVVMLCLIGSAIALAHPLHALHGTFAVDDSAFSVSLQDDSDAGHAHVTVEVLNAISVFDRSGERIDLAVSPETLIVSTGEIERWPISVAFRPVGRASHASRVVLESRAHPEIPLVLAAHAPGARLDREELEAGAFVPTEPTATIDLGEGYASVRMVVPLATAAHGIVAPGELGDAIGVGDDAHKRIQNTLGKRLVGAIGSGEPIGVRLVIPSAEYVPREPLNAHLAWCQVTFGQRIQRQGRTELTLPLGALGLESVAVVVNVNADRTRHGIVTLADPGIELVDGDAKRIGRNRIDPAE